MSPFGWTSYRVRVSREADHSCTACAGVSATDFSTLAGGAISRVHVTALPYGWTGRTAHYSHECADRAESGCTGSAVSAGVLSCLGHGVLLVPLQWAQCSSHVQPASCGYSA